MTVCDAPVLDSTRIQMINELGGQQSLEIWRALLVDIPQWCSALLLAHEQHDVPSMRRRIHAIAGSAGSCGAVRLVSATMSIEPCIADPLRRRAAINAVIDAGAETTVAVREVMEQIERRH